MNKVRRRRQPAHRWRLTTSALEPTLNCGGFSMLRAIKDIDIWGVRLPAGQMTIADYVGQSE